MCLHPIIIMSKKFKGNKYWKCKWCKECKQERSKNWTIRLTKDIEEHTNGKYITLVITNDMKNKITDKLKNKETDIYKLQDQIAAAAIRGFLERWRRKYKVSVRHWFVTDLKLKKNIEINLHGIIWTDEPKETIQKIWNGKTSIDEPSIINLTEYVKKTDAINEKYNNTILTSPRIGKIKKQTG